MKRIAGIFTATALVSSLALAGCSGGGAGKCEKLIDKSIEAAMEMAKAFGGGEDAEKKMAEMKAEIEKKKPEAVKQCATALENHKELEKTVDCLIAAKDLEAMGKCEGADKLSGIMK